MFYNVVMKKALLFIFLLILFQAAAFSAPKKMVPSNNSDIGLSNVFIYAIPDDNELSNDADFKLEKYVEEKEQSTEEEIVLDKDNIAIGATVLKGYAQFIEDTNAIYLRDSNNEFVLNIKTPQKISASKGLNLSSYDYKRSPIRYVNDEYLITPKSIKSSSKIGDFTIGAQYNDEIDNIAMLERETGFFARYEKNRFALNSSVTKSLNTTYAQDYNTLSIEPELKINNYISLKNKFSADVTRNRRSSKLVFSINPFGKNDDRVRFELGAKQTYNMETEATSTQFSFSTQFKL